jgi:adenosylcobinamide-phosphate synthase
MGGVSAAAIVCIAALWCALALDALWGEPPARLHPVVWMGRYLDRGGRLVAPATAGHIRKFRPFVAGTLVWCAGAAMVGVAALTVEAAAHRLPSWLAWALLGFALKPLLAWRMLRDEVLAVEAALGVSLDAGRAQLARLVSRDVSTLTPAQVRESAIESLAENLNDSVVAPVFWFALAGLPGAAVYRFANTADAMWGYRGERGGRDWTWAGKFAARADDVLSWVPARITALLLAVVARRWPTGLWREAGRTPSPNSGWSMAAMALLLHVRLGKPGIYVLNAPGRLPLPADTHRSAGWGSLCVLILAVWASVWLLAAAPA